MASYTRFDNNSTFRVVGDADRFMHVMAEYGLGTRRLGSTATGHTIALEPA